MPIAPVIVVRRELVEVAVTGDEVDGLAVQRHLAGRLDGIVAPSLEAAFGEVDLGDDHLAIDRLEIDVAPRTFAEIDLAIADAVRRQTRELLRDHLVRSSSGERDQLDHAPVQRRSEARSVATVLAEFLSTGRMPWSFPGSGADGLEATVRATWARIRRDGLPDPGWPIVRAALAQRRARERLVRQFSPDLVDEVLLRLSPAVAATAGRVLNASEGGTDPVGDPGGGSDGVVWTRMVRLVAVETAHAGGVIDEATLAQAAREAVARRVRVEVGVPGPRPIADRAGRTAAAAEDGSVSHGGHPLTEAARPVDAERGERAPGELVADGAGDEFTRSPVAAGLEEGEAAVVEHAGVVLLHPFLSRLFTGVGLCDETGALTEPDRAVCLLHHAATGARFVPEHETTVAKLLCGVPFDEPLDRDPSFTAVELDEVEALLLAVVDHWDALRSTTPAGLRAEFLTRPGLLSADHAGDPLLRVEQRTSDILLGRLPWGISMVQTPWMDRLLRVEWGS